jgi:hypothetical protein
MRAILFWQAAGAVTGPANDRMHGNNRAGMSWLRCARVRSGTARQLANSGPPAVRVMVSSGESP